MNTFYKTILLIFWATIGLQAKAQIPTQLKVGDTLPKLTIQHLLKHQDRSGQLSEIRNSRFMIINFWATWCTPCVKEMKLLSEMVKKNKGSLSVLSVSYETKKAVLEFLNLHKEIKNSILEIACEDNILKQYFFYQSLPHNIWIDSEGVIKAITGSDEINEENVLRFIKDGDLNFSTKIDEAFDWSKPLHIPDSLIQFRSIFNTKLKNVHLAGSLIDRSGLNHPNMKHFFCYNLGIIDLFWPAYRLPGFLPNEYLYEIQTNDSLRFFYNKNGISASGKSYKYRSTWEEDNAYCYELKTNKPIEDSLFFRHVISDLELNLNVVTSLEYRDRLCCIVTANIKPVFTDKIGNNNKTYINIEGNRLVLRNVTIDKLLEWMVNFTYKSPRSGNSFRKEPYVNNTDIGYTISAEIDLGSQTEEYTHYDYLEKCINKGLGLQFQLKKQPYKVLIIRDK